jgi:hypothetical protein
VLDAHRLAEQVYVIDDREWVARLFQADLPVAGVIDGGKDIDARVPRCVQNAGDGFLPLRTADPSDPLRSAVPPQSVRIFDVDQFETRDRPQDRPCALPVEIGLRLARMVVHGDPLLDRPNEWDSVQVPCDECRHMLIRKSDVLFLRDDFVVMLVA